jgi:hypothetical protein
VSSLKRQGTAPKSLLTRLPTTISICILVGVQGAQRRRVIYEQGAEQKGVSRAYETAAGTAYYYAPSSSTQEESKASSTALGKESINGIERGTSSSVRARGGSLSLVADKQRKALLSLLGTGTTAITVGSI